MRQKDNTYILLKKQHQINNENHFLKMWSSWSLPLHIILWHWGVTYSFLISWLRFLCLLMYLIISKSSSQEKAVLPCNFGVFHNKKGEKNCIVLSPCCIKTTWAYLEWSSTTLVNKTLTKRIWFKFGDVVEPVWRVWTFFGAASELSVMLKGQKSNLTKINTYQIFFKDVSNF